MKTLIAALMVVFGQMAIGQAISGLPSTPSGAAGGALSGPYPNPGYAVQPLVPANNLSDVSSNLTSLANLGADPCSGQITNGNGLFCVDNFIPALYPGIDVSPTAWSSGTGYPPCTAVSYSGGFYVAVAGNGGSVTPGTSSTVWAPVPLGLTPLQTDCANAYATSYLLNDTTVSGACPVLYFGGANHANGSNGNYFTNITVQVAPASWTGSCAISLQGSGMTNTYLVQDQVVTIGTVNLPTPTGGGNNFKRFSVRDMTINAAGNAPYALQILGSHYQSIFENLWLRGGTNTATVTPSQALFGTSGSSSNWGYQDHFKNILAASTWNSCVPTGTVSLSGGLPTIAITSGSSGCDANVTAHLLGFQSGTSNNPCSSMGAVTVTVASGAVTAATSTATGCSGTVGIVFDDDPVQVGLDFEYVTDSVFDDIKSQSGSIAGIVIKHGTNTFTGVHSFPVNGLYGIQNWSENTFYGVDMGEMSSAQFDTNGTGPTGVTMVYGGMYAPSQQHPYSSIFRNELSANQTYAHDVFCNYTQTGEFHTLVTPTGTIDSNTSAETSAGDEMYNVGYCGSGTGGTLNFTSRAFTAPSITAAYPNTVASVDHTGEAANIGATTAYAVPSGAAGTYLISVYMINTQAAGSTSTFPNSVITWTDEDTGSSTGLASTVTSTNSSNGLNHASYGTQIVHAAASTNIQYQTQSYASSGSPALNYAIHIKVVYLGP